MSTRELRKLYSKLRATSHHVGRARTDAWKHLQSTITSEKNVWRLQNRALYWIGKKRAENCPAFKPSGSHSAKCMVHQPEYASSLKNVYHYRCSDCRLHRKTRMKVGTFNGVFVNPSP